MTSLAHKPHWLYRCYDTEGFLLYIGVTSDLAQRIASHRHPPKNCSTPSRELAHRMAYHEAEEYPDRASAFDAEALSIRREHPPLNVKHAEGHALTLYSATHKTPPRRKEEMKVLEKDYKLAEVAELLGVSTKWIRKQIQLGADPASSKPFVEHIRRGNRIMFTADQVEKFRMADAEVPPPVESITTGRRKRA